MIEKTIIFDDPDNKTKQPENKSDDARRMNQNESGEKGGEQERSKEEGDELYEEDIVGIISGDDTGVNENEENM